LVVYYSNSIKRRLKVGISAIHFALLKYG